MEKQSCEGGCPYFTSQAPLVETSAMAADIGGACGGVGLLYLIRQFRARNCEGPYPLSAEVTYCSTLRRGILPNGRRASSIVDTQSWSPERIEACDLERWRELYEECKSEQRQEYSDHMDIYEAGLYSDEEISFVRGTSVEQVADIFGVDLLNPESIQSMYENTDIQEKMASYGRLVELRDILTSVDKISLLQQQLGPTCTQVQAIEAAIVMEDAVMRRFAAVRLGLEQSGPDGNEPT